MARRTSSWRCDNVIRENPIFLGKKNDLHKPFTGNGETELQRVKGAQTKCSCRRHRKKGERKGERRGQKQNLLRENMRREARNASRAVVALSKNKSAAASATDAKGNFILELTRSRA